MWTRLEFKRVAILAAPFFTAIGVDHFLQIRLFLVTLKAVFTPLQPIMVNLSVVRCLRPRDPQVDLGKSSPDDVVAQGSVYFSNFDGYDMFQRALRIENVRRMISEILPLNITLGQSASISFCFILPCSMTDGCVK